MVRDSRLSLRCGIGAQHPLDHPGVLPRADEPDHDAVACHAPGEGLAQVIDGFHRMASDGGESIPRLQFHLLGAATGNDLVDEDSRALLHRGHAQESGNAGMRHRCIRGIGSGCGISKAHRGQVTASKADLNGPGRAAPGVPDRGLDTRNGRLQHIPKSLDGANAGIAEVSDHISGSETRYLTIGTVLDADHFQAEVIGLHHRDPQRDPG